MNDSKFGYAELAYEGSLGTRNMDRNYLAGIGCNPEDVAGVAGCPGGIPAGIEGDAAAWINAYAKIAKVLYRPYIALELMILSREAESINQETVAGQEAEPYDTRDKQDNRKRK